MKTAHSLAEAQTHFRSSLEYIQCWSGQWNRICYNEEDARSFYNLYETSAPYNIEENEKSDSSLLDTALDAATMLTSLPDTVASVFEGGGGSFGGGGGGSEW